MDNNLELSARELLAGCWYAAEPEDLELDVDLADDYASRHSTRFSF